MWTLPPFWLFFNENSRPSPNPSEIQRDPSPPKLVEFYIHSHQNRWIWSTKKKIQYILELETPVEMWVWVKMFHSIMLFVIFIFLEWNWKFKVYLNLMLTKQNYFYIQHLSVTFHSFADHLLALNTKLLLCWCKNYFNNIIFVTIIMYLCHHRTIVHPITHTHSMLCDVFSK